MSFAYESSNRSSSYRCNLECKRCAATSIKTGKQCKRTTCKMLPMCPQHAKLILHLEVRTSTIPDAGYGLFTLVARAKGDTIAVYTGHMLSHNQKEELYGSGKNDLAPYVVEVDRDHFLDSACSRSIGSFANASPGANNAKLYVVNNTVELIATRDIAAGQEIFLDYGSKYFTRAKGAKPVFSTSTRKIRDETVLPPVVPRDPVRKSTRQRPVR